MTREEILAPVRQWLVEPLPPDVTKSIARLRRLPDARHVAVLPDVHLASDVCVGVAMATSRLIYPAAVGSDIGCGMAAMAIDANASLLIGERNAVRVLRELPRQIPALKHRAADVSTELPAHLSEMLLSCPRLRKIAEHDGRYQMGTVGRGNHFVELQADGADRLWLMVHSGSRGMGQAITHHHRSRASAAGASGLLSLDAETPQGMEYLADAAWAVEYAAANRAAMLEAVADLLRELFGVEPIAGSLLQTSHNHVRREVHFGQPMWVHRKGAMPAAEGEAGMIPGSMGTASFHVTGRGCDEALGSSSHGAGRARRRGDAMRAIDSGRLEREMRGVWYDRRQAARLCDEAPSAYKDIHAVMRAQRALVRIERVLRPVLNYKAT
jgi:tRNA-splicing ligase RtcB